VIIGVFCLSEEKKIRMEHLEILKLIRDGDNTCATVSKRLKISYSTISDRIRFLLNHGFINKGKRSRTRHYRLTSKGKKQITDFCTHLQGASKNKITTPKRLRAHHVVVFFHISKAPDGMISQLRQNKFMTTDHSTWKGYQKREHDCLIIFNPKKVFLHMDAFYVDSPDQYHAEVMKRAMEVKDRLEKKYQGLVLGDPHRTAIIHKTHVARELGPLATHFKKAAIQTGIKQEYRGDRLVIDSSSGEYEEETVHPVHAPEDMEKLGEFFQGVLKKDLTAGDLGEIKEQLPMILQLVNANTQTSNRSLEILNKMVHSNEIFATAMHEHVTLVKSLQEVAQQNKQGMELIAKAVIELSKPWYERLYDTFKRIYYEIRRNNKKHDSK
jgi:predicted transcriptional regulator